MSPGLTKASLPELQRLQHAVSRGDVDCPLGQVELLRCGFGDLWPRLVPLHGLGREAVLAVLDAVLAERTAHSGPELDLVWTGPDLQQGVVRDTAAVVRELLSQARREVVIGGCYFSAGRDILRPLHTAMRERGVKVLFCMDVGDHHRIGPVALDNAQRSAVAFVQDNWPFGRPLPAFYYDRRTAVPGAMVKLHAKCIVVDDRIALVTSANFTYLGQTENIEAGVLIRDPGFAGKLASQFRFLIEAERLVPCPLPDSFEVVEREVPEGWEDAAECVPERFAGLVDALIAAGVPGPDDYGAELSMDGRVTDQTCLMHWGEGLQRLSLADLVEDAARFDGRVIAVRPDSPVETLATQVAQLLRAQELA